MPNPLKFVFWGTPDVASETLEILKKADFLPSLIITAPDKPKGRKMLITPPPVKIWAIENNIPYLQPNNLGELENIFRTSSEHDGARKAIRQQADMSESKNVFKFDLAVVVAYGKIIPEKLLNFSKLGSINIHYSLLPKYRGASPVESAILAGDIETGISIQKMEYKMDSGPIIASEKIAISPNEKAEELRKRLIKIGGELLVKKLPDFISKKIILIPQNEKEATFCKKIKKEDGLINLGDDPIKNYNKFRAYAVWPRTYFFQPARPHDNLGAGGNEKRIIITDAKLENGQFVIKKIIPENGKEMEYKTTFSN